MSKEEYLITDTPLKALTIFAMPMILGSFFQQIYNMAELPLFSQQWVSNMMSQNFSAVPSRKAELQTT